MQYLRIIYNYVWRNCIKYCGKCIHVWACWSILTCVIHVPCWEATYIHHFYSILSIYCVCRLIFTYITILGAELDTWHCLQNTGSSATVHVAQPGQCEHGGNTPLPIPTICDPYFNNLRWCFIHWHERGCARCSQSASIPGCILGLVEGRQLSC